MIPRGLENTANTWDDYFAEAIGMFYLDNEHKYELSYRTPLTLKFIENLEEIVN